ncbi:bridging integrator 2a [Labrus mixtus]|uniref:bridging integrator 2a n=1 Tax=Labrus mixtus TaxID=508554 RepID=UPI0029C080B6|nr:bridging integrator 2a [Labrus mixtus]
MAENTSPKSSSGDFAKKFQRRLSRGKEKVLQRLGKSVETRDDHFEQSLQHFMDQQTDGNRIYKDLRHYINAVRDMREASRRLSQSLFDAYEHDWAAGEDLGAIVEGEDLLWNDYEVKLMDQAIRTMESYVSQFPDVKEKVAKRGRKLVDYDSSLHQLEALQTAKKRDDVKIKKAEEDMNAARSVYEGLNNDLKDDLPQLFESRIGCYVSVFSSLSSLRDVFHKEMSKLSLDLNSVIKELQAQHPENVFAVRGMQRYGSLKRRSMMSPKAWKASFSEFHKSYSPKPGQRFSLKSPDKPRHSTLSRESSTLTVTPQSSILESPPSEFSDLDSQSIHSETPSSPSQEDSAEGAAGSKPRSGEESGQVEEKDEKEEESEPPGESDNQGDGAKAPPSDSSSELNNSCDSESLDMQLSAAGVGALHIEEREDSPVHLESLKANGLENGEVSGFDSDIKDLSGPHKDDPAENQASPNVRNTVV